LLKRIEEFGKYVAITGFRNAEFKDIEEFFKIIRKEKPSNVEIQFFDAKHVATWQHLHFAVLNALTAFKNNENISKSLAMETMLYASAQRQIRKAVELLGINVHSSKIAMLVIGEKSEIVKSALSMVSKHVQAQLDDTVLELSEEKAAIIRKTFGISAVELKTIIKNDHVDEALTDLVLERMALLTTQR
jgi:tRNA threonylcarbamoyladenosine modification (KEOPS) complex Cgi121 subunit